MPLACTDAAKAVETMTLGRVIVALTSDSDARIRNVYVCNVSAPLSLTTRIVTVEIPAAAGVPTRMLNLTLYDSRVGRL